MCQGAASVAMEYLADAAMMMIINLNYLIRLVARVRIRAQPDAAIYDAMHARSQRRCECGPSSHRLVAAY